MDIVFADNMKRDIRVVLWYLKRKLKKEHNMTIEMIRDDLDNCGNPVIAMLWKEVKEMASKIKEKYQRDIAIDFPMIALWIVYKDTAYDAPFMYIIKKVLDKKDKLEKYVDKYYKEPEDWYVNRWHDTKEHTAELKKKGKLPPDVEGAMAIDEEIFVPTYQKKKLEIIDREIKKRRKALDWGDKSLNDLD